MENQKSIILKDGGDAYFDRNLNVLKMQDATLGCKAFGEFCKNNNLRGENIKVLEIGSCYGYDLKYLYDNFGFKGYGVEPSKKAVDYGNELYNDSKIELFQGTSDRLEFDDNYFDIVMVGFCWYWVDRELLYKCVAETDRVLKSGGYLVIWDFDTKVPYVRDNIHTKSANTYKMDIPKLFLSNPQYFMVEKRSYSDNGFSFCKDIQGRMSTNILYKEVIQNSYIFN